MATTGTVLLTKPNRAIAAVQVWQSRAGTLGYLQRIGSAAMRTTRIRVTMREVRPTVVRVLDVPAAARLPELHDLLQAGLGWTDSHLHEFVADGISYGRPEIDGPEDERDETAVMLRLLPQRFSLPVRLGGRLGARRGGDRPRRGAAGSRRRGEGACPPEDVGGPHGYADFRAVIGRPRPR